MTEQLAEDVFRLAGEGVEVPAAPVDEVVAAARATRGRRWRVVAACVAGVLVVVGVATWIGARPSGEPEGSPGPTGVVRAENPASVAWWAGGVLHLAHVTVELPHVEEVVGLGDGAVVGDAEGNVVLVDGDGSLATIGRKAVGAPVVASEHQGWVAWVDPRVPAPQMEPQGPAPQLVVYDVDTRQPFAVRELPTLGPRHDSVQENQPIAVDGNQVFYAGEDGDWGWVPDQATLVDVDGLLDVSAATIVRRAGVDRIRIVQPFFSVEFVRQGRGAQLSPGGEYVLTRTTSRRFGGAFGPVLIYDTRSGDKLWTGLRRRDVAMAATLGPDDEVTYVVAHRTGERQDVEFTRTSYNGPYELRTCHLGERTCFTVTSIPQTGVLPVLAR
ncbi:hypothetical protein ACT8ZV_17585 [Nocardioides sp. MAHUQ-72]|uniref:hypothetical protein n=1 Tax=unclassified Nocardioides TaxID=2615069 RepID=UPI003621F574